MILITSARYVNSELISEFGKIPPAFLPIANKKLYEYQANLFANLDEQIILTIPKSYKLSKIDELNFKKFKIKCEKINEKLSLAESILEVLNLNLELMGWGGGRYKDIAC